MAYPLYALFLLVLVRTKITNATVPPEPTLTKCPGSSVQGDEITLPESIMTNYVDTTFRLQMGKWKCDHGFERVTLKAQVKNGTVINETNLDLIQFSIPQIFPNGLFEHIGNQTEYFSPADYCIDSVEPSEINLRLCKIKCGGDVTCVPKCCNWGEAFSNEGCASMGEQEWSPIVQNGMTCPANTPCRKEDWKKQKLHYTKAELNCEDFHSHFQNAEPFIFMTNGAILFTNSIVISSDFCMEGYLNDSGVLISNMFIKCAKEETPEETQQRKIAENVSLTYSIAMFISSFFLFMTALVYILIWDKQNLHGYTVFSHSVSMFFMLVFLGTSHLMSINLDVRTSGSFSCVAVALFSHYFFLSTFCWLTMLNFDLWWTFKTLSPTIAKSKGLQRFFFYSAFAWGLPTLMLFFAFVLDHTSSPSSITLAQYGIHQCFIAQKSQGYYLYLPIGTLLLVNLGFFGSTVYIMYKYQQSTRSAREGKANGQSQSFQLFAKLFLVMGVTWIFEVISWLCKKDDEVSIVWLVFDFINLLQGIAIFIIFVCKRQVLSHLWNKYPRLRWLLSPLTRLPCCRTTQMDVEGREFSAGRTTQSQISMKNYSRASSISES